MTVEDVARYPDFAAWMQGSQLFVDAYREVTADPAAWWWTSQLLGLTLGLIGFLHVEAERRGFRAWPYVWLGLCVAVSVTSSNLLPPRFRKSRLFSVRSGFK